jgi:hypothetical protein
LQRGRDGASVLRSQWRCQRNRSSWRRARRRMMMNHNTQANGANRLSGLSSPSWTSRAVALNETCPAFGVFWSPVHSRLLIDCYHDHISLVSARLSWRLLVICCAVPARARSSCFSFPITITHDPTILLSIPHFPSYVS